MKTYDYVKDNGDKSTRVLHDLKIPTTVMALDISELDEEMQTKAVRLYEQWNEEHNKPYNKKQTQFKKENLKPLSEFFEENGIPSTVMLKSFKIHGLTEK